MNFNIFNRDNSNKPAKCPQCGKTFIYDNRNVGTNCCVLHAGGCCHWNDTEVNPKSDIKKGGLDE